MATANTDRNLLFGILALQMDFISRDALIKGMNTWALEKAKGLGQVLVEQQVLSSQRQALLEALVQEHLKQHNSDPQQSLAAVNAISTAREALQEIADPEVHASLAHVSATRQAETDPWATKAPSVGTSTSSGLRFRILRPHAKGGLGQVSVALDEELHREVALKEIQDRYADDPGSRGRFVLEAEITGGLEHPGIVPVYGLGCYADGRPFYAMRFIKGDSLEDAIERFHKAEGPHRDPSERTLELRKLLGGFIDVCNAVAYAHSRGVLHRDLKPGNIMLGKYGETLVVDWGLAKPLDRPEAPATYDERPLRPASASGSALTEMGQAMGTPAYMSPEQAAGRLDQLGPASDVYCLGATLYSLLTGRAPFEASDLGVVLRKVQRGDFPRPRQRDRQVAPALEAICLKAMALRPEDRYASALEMAGEVEHWLADEPVAAYPEPLQVRAGRWARRHKTLVAAAVAAAVVAVLLGGTGTWWVRQQQAAAADRQRGIEEKTHLALERGRALLEQGWRTNNLGKLNEAKSDGERAVELADSGAGTPTRQEAVSFRKEVEVRIAAAEKAHALLIALLDVADLHDADTYRTDEADLMALGWTSTDEQYAEAFRRWGLDVDRTPVAEIVARFREQPKPVLHQIIAALDNWMWDRRQKKHGDQNWQRLRQLADELDPSDSRRRLRAILAGAENKDQATLAGTVWLSVARAQSRQSIAPGLLPYLSGVAEATITARAGEQVQRETIAAAFTDPTTEPVLTIVLLARAYQALGDATEAERVLRLAVAKRPDQVLLLNALGKLLGPDRSVGFDAQGSLIVYRNEKLAEAIECFRAARALRPQLGIALGAALGWAGRAMEAEAVLRDLVGQQPNNPEVHFYLGRALHYQKKVTDAEASYRKAIELKPNYAEAYFVLGTALLHQKRVEEAIAAYRKAIEIKPNYGAPYARLGGILYDQALMVDGATLAVNTWSFAARAQCRQSIAAGPIPYLLDVAESVITARDQNKLEEAEAAYRKAIEVDPNNGVGHNGLGIVLYRKKDWDGASGSYRQAIELSPRSGVYQSNLGDALRQKGDLDKAIAAYRKAIELMPNYVPAHNGLGVALYNHKKPDEAAAAFRKAIELDPGNAVYHDNLGNALREQKKFDAAVAAYRKAVELAPGNDNYHNHLGVALYYKRNWEGAVAAYHKAIELSPRTAVYHDNLGNALREQKKFDAAVAAYRKAVQIDPKYAGAHNDLGNALYSQKDWDGASAAYRKAIELAPRNGVYQSNLGGALRDKGSLDKAIVAFHKAIELLPNYAPAHNGLGLTLYNQKKPDEAAAAYRKAIELDPGNAVYHTNLGDALSFLGGNLLKEKKYADAEPVLRGCLAILAKQQPDLWTTFNARSRLGGSLLGQKKYVEAEPLLLQGYEGMKQRAAKVPQERRPRLTEALERLVQFYDALGNKDEAAKWRKELEDREVTKP